jgi:hypothetical protein
MTQHQLNQLAMTYVPLIRDLIKVSHPFEANQMREMTLREMMNTSVAVCDMNESQLKEFQRDLIAVFKHKGWAP